VIEQETVIEQEKVIDDMVTRHQQLDTSNRWSLPTINRWSQI